MLRREVVGLGLGLFFGVVGCMPAKGGDSSFFEAKVGFRNVKPNVAARRLQSPRTLTIVLGPNVADNFDVRPTPDMTNRFSEYRKTIGETLKGTFAGNFAAVVVAPKESGTGLELVVTRAEMQATTTIKYGVTLLSNGKELVDVTGQTDGKTIAMRGNGGDLQTKYTGMIQELTDFALQSLGEKVYDQVMRADDLQKSGFYETLSQPDGAAAASAPAEQPSPG